MESHHHGVMSNKTTLEDIAKAAGVSIATVDRVVNRRGGVSRKAEAKVLEWASRLNLDRRIFRAHLPTLRVAVLIPSPENPFFATMRDAFAAMEGPSSEMQIRIFLHVIDPIDSMATARKLEEVALQYDAAIICCPEQPATSQAVTRASEKIPVITLVTDMPGSGRIAYVGPNNRQIGRVAGELMGRFLGRDGGKVLVMLGHHHIVGHQEREMGFRMVLRERFPGVEIMDIVESEEDRDRAARLAQQALRNTPDLRGIYNVSAGNYGIVQTLIQLGRETGTVFITHELTPQRREMLRSGLLDAVIDQNPRMEARRAIDILAHHFKRGDLSDPAETSTPFEIFLRENCG